MARRSTLRASDEDRERVAQRLHQAATEGRLLAHELEERLHQVLRARTYGELDAVVADLPGQPAPRRQRSAIVFARRHPLAAAGVALGVTVVATVVVAAVVAFVSSGLVLVPLAWFAWAKLRGRRGRRGRLPGLGAGPGPGAHVHVHMHRYDSRW